MDVTDYRIIKILQDDGENFYEGLFPGKIVGF